MGAGILPMAFTKNGNTITLYILLGQERDKKNKLWCDFGGSEHHNELTFAAAIREGYEETNGLLGDINELENIVSKNLLLHMSFNSYTSYVYRAPYDRSFPKLFDNSNKFAERNLKYVVSNSKNGLFEKVQVKWFRLSHFKDPNNRKILRNFYNAHIEYLLKHEEEIKNAIISF